MLKRILLVLILLGLMGMGLQRPIAAQGNCPAATIADPKGLTTTYFGQIELADFQAAAKCTLTFADNPLFSADVQTNKLPAVDKRLPAEPLVVLPNASIGKYGGTMFGLALQPESGTSEVLSWHHNSLVRYSDDGTKIIPHVAKSFTVNADFTAITFTLRKGHKWSDGEPFTADDIDFWYNDLQLNTELNPQVKSDWLYGGQPMKVTKVDDVTVKFAFAAPAPTFLPYLATTFIQPFQPKHFLQKYHIKYNPKANDDAKARGFEKWTQLMEYYYTLSDWKDTPSAPLLKGDTAIAPTLESHTRSLETPNAREWKANPYYFAVDTAGNQLPYVNLIHEDFVDAEVQTLKITQGAITLKAQDAVFANITVYRENEAKGGYKAVLVGGPGADAHVAYGFNPTGPDKVLTTITTDIRFRQALSLAINREEVNQLVYSGQGKPIQWLPVDHNTVTFITNEMLNYEAQFDPKKANALLDTMGLTKKNSDGIRLRPDGQPLVLKLNYSAQGGPRQVHELVRDYWNAVGVRLELNELGSDELNNLLSKNEHSIGSWAADGTQAFQLATSPRFAPPFNAGDFGAGIPWRQWYDTKGAEGQEPPADVKRLFDIQAKLATVDTNSDEFKTLILEAVKIHQNNLFLIGVVGDVPKPIIVSNKLANFPTIKFYGPGWHMYQFRPWQFFLK